GRVTLGEIVVVDDDRQYLAVEFFLDAVAAHPGARALAGPGEIVVQKETDRAARRILYLVGAHIGMVDWAVGTLDKADAEQPARRVEGGADHIVEHEIRLHRRLVDLVAGLPHLLAVIAPVPRLDRLVEAVGK